jgi:hypothetical protein
VSIKGTTTIFTDQTPNFHVEINIQSMLASKFSTVYNLVVKDGEMKGII